MSKCSLLAACLVSAVSLSCLPVQTAHGQIVVSGQEGEFVVEAVDIDFGPMIGDFASAARRERDRMEPVTAEELERYNTRLGLDTAQVVFTNEMFTGYRERLLSVNGEEQAVRMAFAEQMRKGHEDGGGWNGDQMREAISAMESSRSELAAKRAAMTEEFFADYRLVLTPEQLEEWPAIERMRRRDRELAPGTFPGEDIDLIALCGEMELEFDPERVSEGGPAMMDELLGRYEIEIDRLLVSRLAIEAEHPMAESRGSGMFAVEIDMDAMEEWRSEHHEAAARLQSAQKKYARQVGELLSAESRAALEARLLELSYPRVVRASIVDSQLEAIGALEDVDDEQRAELDRLAAEYRRARQRLDQAWIAAIDSEIADGGGSSAGLGNVQVFFATGGGEESDLAKARRERRELDRQWADRVRAVLRPEQAEKVPAPASPRGTIIHSFSEIDPETGEETESITVEIQGSEEGN